MTNSTMNRRTHAELLQYDTFKERFEYLSLRGRVGAETFGFERWMNQEFYRSREWRSLREKVIIRDEGCDLAIPGMEVYDRVIIHHIVPMTPEDFETGNPLILDLNNLITTTHNTHNAIHYGDASLLREEWTERTPGDTLLWTPIQS